MGFPSISHIAVPKTLVDLLELWDDVKFMVRLALFYLGVFDPANVTPTGEDTGSRHPSTANILFSPPSCSPEEIKKLLPVAKFSSFLSRTRAGEEQEDAGVGKEEEDFMCAVCLNCLEGEDEMRELCNCSHVFHIGCLDKWVDQGQMTCPLCRSVLLPHGDERGKGCGGSWMVERISYMFGEDLVSI